MFEGVWANLPQGVAIFQKCRQNCLLVTAGVHNYHCAVKNYHDRLEPKGSCNMIVHADTFESY